MNHGSRFWNLVSELIGDVDVRLIDCHYPLIQQSNQAPYHFLQGYVAHLNELLDLEIGLTRYRGDIHVSPKEKSWMSQVHEAIGRDTPFWIIVAGGKFDYTIKWWEPRRYQKVVDHFAGKIDIFSFVPRIDMIP